MDAPLLIVGAGAIATLFAAQLASAGMKVVMLTSWEEAIQKISERGVCAIFPDGRSVGGLVQITSDPEEIGRIRRALVLVKAWQTPQAALQLEKVLTSDGVAFSLQNGLGNLEVLAERLGPRRSACGVTVVGATIQNPGIVHCTGSVTVQGIQDMRLFDLYEQFEKAGIRVEMQADLGCVQWRKLIVNAAINPLSAVLGVCNGALWENTHSQYVLTGLAREALAVAEASGYPFNEVDMIGEIREICRKTAANHSSMLQDVRRGVQTEIDAINGALVQIAGGLGVDVPLNRCFVSLVKSFSEASSLFDGEKPGG